MLCSSCRTTLAKRLRSSQPTSILSLTTSRRSVATAPATPNAAPTTPPPSTQAKSPSAGTPEAIAATSQPFSSPFFPSTSIGAPTPNVATPRKFASSVPGGTPLSTLSYVKNPTKPLLAKEDSEYPAWLWSLLDPPKTASSITATTDPSSSSTIDTANIISPEELASMTKKARAKYERKMAKLNQNIEKPVPIHEQSADLTGAGDDVFQSLKKRSEVTKSARAARRKELRETNFLRTM